MHPRSPGLIVDLDPGPRSPKSPEYGYHRDSSCNLGVRPGGVPEWGIKGRPGPLNMPPSGWDPLGLHPLRPQTRPARARGGPPGTSRARARLDMRERSERII